MSSTIASICGRVRECGDRRRLGERRQVVRQAHEPQGVGDGRVGREVAESRAGEGEGLAHGAGDDQPRAAGEQRQRRDGASVNSAYASSTSTMPSVAS